MQSCEQGIVDTRLHEAQALLRQQQRRLRLAVGLGGEAGIPHHERLGLLVDARAERHPGTVGQQVRRRTVTADQVEPDDRRHEPGVEHRALEFGRHALLEATGPVQGRIEIAPRAQASDEVDLGLEFAGDRASGSGDLRCRGEVADGRVPLGEGLMAATPPGVELAPEVGFVQAQEHVLDGPQAGQRFRCPTRLEQALRPGDGGAQCQQAGESGAVGGGRGVEVETGGEGGQHLG